MQKITTSSVFEFKGIGTLLKAGRLKVPPNQREYSWEDKHIGDLFRDFQNAIRNKQSIYFLGTIVISKGSKNVPEVVDGQQRLATTTILLAAIRDYFYLNKQETLQASIDTEYLYKIDREQVETVPKLALNTDDNEYFKNRIIALPNAKERQSVEPKKESHKRIDFAANKAESLVQDLVKNQTDFRNIKDILNEWLEFIDNKATIIHLTVPDEVNAFMMFETLNDRGLKTSQADLVKNFLFHEAGDRIQEAQQKWSRMIAILETLGIEDIVMTYLRHLMITLYGPTREKEIFEKIQKEVQGRGQAISFLDKLADYANSYAAILTPTHEKWNSYPAQIGESIANLRELKVQQIRPLMLAVAKHFEPSEALTSFRSFICWTVRFLISGGMRGGQLEDAYGDQALSVSMGKIKTTKELLDSLVTVIPSDEEFRTAFTTARVSQHNLARYYLRAIERCVRKDVQPELVPERDTDFLNLEHILPYERSNNWPHIDSETADAYTKRIGNMTLLNATTNADFGNAPFQTKRLVYKKSPLAITQLICELTNEQTLWSPIEINERQKKLADLAVNTWSLSPK
ncbi:DUF262 domain-containing HNH endonuclease family protein [Candidatus Bathyarchaeota archaeon]|nr:DUF262 domain-containing HNH endonuclease family protein [Candidatus Bathyarchaeota archaeon]